MLDRKQPPHLAKKRIISVASNLMGVALYSIMGDKDNKEMSVHAEFLPKKKVVAKQNFKEGQFLVHSAFPNVTPSNKPARTRFCELRLSRVCVQPGASYTARTIVRATHSASFSSRQIH